MSGLAITGLSVHLYDDSKVDDRLIAGGKGITNFTRPSVGAGSKVLLEIIGKGNVNCGGYAGLLQVTPSAVSLHAATWLLLSGLAGMGLMVQWRVAA